MALKWAFESFYRTFDVMTRRMKLHERALELSKIWKQTEAELVAVLIAMQRENAFVRLGYQGIYSYCKEALNLSEAQSYYFRRVVEASLVVPTFEKAVTSGQLSLSQARRIVPVVTRENPEEWIEKAKVLPQRELEKEVARVNPDAKPIERMRQTSENQVTLTVTVSPKVAAMLRRLQDLEAQRTKKAATLGETLGTVAEEYLERHDPVRKAERAKPLPKSFPQESTRAIPAAIKHAVVRRDQGKCVRCGSSRWLEIHHKKALSKGGLTTPDNLITLCGAHHKLAHDADPPNQLPTTPRLQERGTRPAGP